MWPALKSALIATVITGAICAAAVLAKAQAPPFQPQQVTWFCRTAERVDALMMSPGRAFMAGLMFSIAKGDCGIGLHGTTFVFLPEAVAAKGTSAEGDAYVVLKGRLFPRIEEGIEAYAPFDAASFHESDEKKTPEPTAGQPI
ncbi:MAG: hypothetical protein ACR2PO_08740 [Methyloligellaceae bacterium]